MLISNKGVQKPTLAAIRKKKTPLGTTTFTTGNINLVSKLYSGLKCTQTGAERDTIIKCHGHHAHLKSTPYN